VLYVTTRDKHDIHTANKTLTSNFSTDGGLFIPRSMPVFSKEEIATFKGKSFNEIFATVLNSFYSEQITGREVDFFIGRNPVKIVPVGRKILIAQVWQNPEHQYAYIENNIFKRLRKGESASETPTQWLKITVRIATVFATYGQLLQAGQLRSGQALDIAVDADDYVSVIAAFYAAKIGLPVGKLVCGCDVTGIFWDFIHLGEISTGVADEELLRVLERMIHTSFGSDEVRRFIEVCQKRGTYRIPEDPESDFTESVFGAVVGKTRVASVVNSVYRTDNLFMDTCAARSFGAIQDFRSKTGSSNLTLLFSDNHPVLEADFIMKATGLSRSAFLDKCKFI